MLTAIMTFFDLEAPTINHVNQPLSAYAGKVLLVVNVASACGFTPQYEGLEALSARLAPRGFAVLGFPSNEFGAQEPGTEAEIKTFCDTRYHVTFPMFAKVRTKGADKSPVYQFLTAREGEPAWNFHKYLVGKDGQVIQAFPSKVKPDDPALLAAIEAAFAAE